MQERLGALGIWNEARVHSTFRHGYKPAQTSIIRLRGADIGWMQVSESSRRLRLHQLHLLAEFRNNGIGTRLLRALQRRAGSRRKPIALSVIRGNPALSLYHRLGFRVVGAGKEKLHMRWRGRS